MKRFLFGLLIAIMGVCVFLLNYYAVPGHDEMSYAFWGQHTPMIGEVNRVSSFMDVVRQQYGDYLTAGGNGRVLTHGIVALFAGFRLYTLFDMVNTCIWFLFVWMILREGNVRIKSLGCYLTGCAVVWWFLWYAESCSMNAAFAVNYLWIACLTVVMMRTWRNLNSWWLVPLFFVYGWTSEVFVLPMIAALAADSVIKSFAAKRPAVNRKQICAWCAMVLGACFLCLGPAAQVRADGTLVGNIFVSAIKANAGLILLGSPLILFLGVVAVLWVRRKMLLGVISTSLEWWLFLGASYGLFCLVSTNGFVRLAMPMLLAGLIILFRERAVFKIKKFQVVAFLMLCMGWMLGATALQVAIGKDVYRMLDRYKKDAQGITFRTPIQPGIFYYTVTLLQYNDWHLALFRREFDLARNPVIFSPWLYENLYQSPQRFFETATPIDQSGLYVSGRAPQTVVVRGHQALSEHQQAVLDSYFASLCRPECGWKRFLPGRLKAMFPREDCFLNIVKENDFRFFAKDGSPYTLYLLPEKRR